MAKWPAGGKRTVFPGDQGRTGHGPIRGSYVSTVASPHHILLAGPFLPLALENQDGKKAPSTILFQLRVLLKVLTNEATNAGNADRTDNLDTEPKPSGTLLTQKKILA